MGDDAVRVLLETVPSATPSHARNAPEFTAEGRTATNVKRCRTRSCSRRSYSRWGSGISSPSQNARASNAGSRPRPPV